MDSVLALTAVIPFSIVTGLIVGVVLKVFGSWGP
jgi:hypothetical protein